MKSTYKRSNCCAIVGSAGVAMHKRTGDSSLATSSASSPVLRGKQRSALVPYCGRRVWRVRRSSSWSAAQRSRGSHPRACTLRIPDQGDLMFSFSFVDSSCEAQHARYRLRRTLLAPNGPDAIFGKLCGWSGLMNSTYSVAWDGIGQLIGWGSF